MTSQFLLSLPRNQVPQWAASYIDYKGLKKLLKSVVIDSQEHGSDIDLAGGISPRRKRGPMS
jgi:glycerophosphodiester phosphodiesterase